MRACRSRVGALGAGCFAMASAVAQTEPTAPVGSGLQPTTRLSILGDSIARVPGELGAIFTYPVRESDEFLKYAAGVALLVALDKPLTRAYQDHVEEPLRNFKVPDAPGKLKNAGTGGTDGWLLLGIAGTYLGGAAVNDPYTQKVGLAAGKSVVYSIAVSQLLLKTVFGRKRPADPLSGGAGDDGIYTDDPYDFGNKRRAYYKSDPVASSFPSFHFTAWFAAARVYQRAYDNYWVPYGLLTVGLASEVKGHRHWVSDMVAGALIGTLIGSAVSEGYLGADERKRGWKVDAAVTADGGQLRLNYVF